MDLQSKYFDKLLAMNTFFESMMQDEEYPPVLENNKDL